MAYASVSIIALIILLITNWDLLFKKYSADKIPASKQYRFFIVSVAVFYVADLLWGIFETYNIHIADYAITVSFFALMSVSVWLWSFYVVAYLGHHKYFAKLFTITGSLLMISGVVLIIVNFIHPILFEFVDGSYKG